MTGSEIEDLARTLRRQQRAFFRLAWNQHGKDQLFDECRRIEQKILDNQFVIARTQVGQLLLAMIQSQQAFFKHRTRTSRSVAMDAERRLDQWLKSQTVAQQPSLF